MLALLLFDDERMMKAAADRCPKTKLSLIRAADTTLVPVTVDPLICEFILGWTLNPQLGFQPSQLPLGAVPNGDKMPEITRKVNGLFEIILSAFIRYLDLTQTDTGTGYKIQRN
ncbi:hypothetical protein PoB_002018200 [Plakobranchus ocellatus]|uniref:Uncharacterized protein n=1 Tax=Plakobranchus ocellatus TaxID=259542 RepID=A0AAV3ZEG4_9GAST|nr:hypothetical protein PoB_002018200 [Plakobranchus ocellatus]